MEQCICEHFNIICLIECLTSSQIKRATYLALEEAPISYKWPAY